MVDLLDASVWVALRAPDHVHHPRARRYWDREAAEELAFCRVTALTLLRQLTNRRVLGEAALDGATFAVAGGCRLVAFDGDFRRYRGVELLHLGRE
ncbi:MAG TPA: hypothetical protein VNO34_09490 [Actinomycetota bacterium]|nr:hypothetical protein [Actinomycetota bacterium]